MLVKDFVTIPATGEKRLVCVPEVCSFNYCPLMRAIVSARYLEMVKFLMTTLRTRICKTIPIGPHDALNIVFCSVVVDDTQS